MNSSRWGYRDKNTASIAFHPVGGTKEKDLISPEKKTLPDRKKTWSDREKPCHYRKFT
jgi:hypothetical protein